MEIKISHILNYLEKKSIENNQIIEHPEIQINGVATLNDATETQITFCKLEEKEQAKEIIELSNSKIIICSKKIINPQKLEEFVMDKNLIFVEKPRQTFIKLFNHFFNPKRKIGISENISLGKLVEIGENAYIGDFVSIGNNVKIGDNANIYPNVVIGDDVHIGDDCTIFGNTTIGSDGFGYEYDKEGNVLKFPHIGGVRIGNNVEIGANTCIDRGTLGNTVIRDGVKIDNLCHIAHNVIIGENSFIIALTIIGGSVRIGNNVWVSPASAILNGLKIGNKSIVGMGAVVIKDVEPNSIVVGVPAKPL